MDSKAFFRELIERATRGIYSYDAVAILNHLDNGGDFWDNPPIMDMRVRQIFHQNMALYGAPCVIFYVKKGELKGKCVALTTKDSKEAVEMAFKESYRAYGMNGKGEPAEISYMPFTALYKAAQMSNSSVVYFPVKDFVMAKSLTEILSGQVIKHSLKRNGNCVEFYINKADSKAFTTLYGYIKTLYSDEDGGLLHTLKEKGVIDKISALVKIDTAKSSFMVVDIKNPSVWVSVEIIDSELSCIEFPKSYHSVSAVMMDDEERYKYEVSLMEHPVIWDKYGASDKEIREFAVIQMSQFSITPKKAKMLTTISWIKSNVLKRARSLSKEYDPSLEEQYIDMIKEGEIQLEDYFELDHGLPDSAKSIRGHEAAGLLNDYMETMERKPSFEAYEYDANDFIKDVTKEEKNVEKQKGTKISELIKQKQRETR